MSESRGGTLELGVNLLLGLICVGTLGLVFVVPSGARRDLAICFLGAGIFILVFHRWMARRVVTASHSLPAAGERFWGRLGNAGVAHFYRWFGIVFLLAGVLLLIRV